MTTPKEILLAIRQLRNGIMATRRRGDARENLKFQCDKISELDLPGQDWASSDMQDPLLPGDRGHSVRVVTTKGKRGVIVSLTGQKILSEVIDISDEVEVRKQLQIVTGAKQWTRKKHEYTRR